MSRSVVIILKILSLILWVITAAILFLALIAGMSGVDVPWLDPLESLIGVIIAGIGGVIAWLSARRVERASVQQTIINPSGPTALGEEPMAVSVGAGNKGSVVVAKTVQLIIREGQTSLVPEASLNQGLTQSLKWLNERTGTIELRGVTRAGNPVSLELDRVYVPLEATAAPKDEVAKSASEQDNQNEGLPHSEPEEITLDRILTLGRHLVITGGPGCGKTTVLRHIAWALTTSFINDSPSFAQQRLGLVDELPIPAYIPLSAFAEHLRELDRIKTAGNRVLSEEFRLDYFIPEYLKENAAAQDLPTDFFTLLLAAGNQVILLLDGLDEVPNETERRRVREKVEQLLTGRRDKMRIVVTCRTAAYHDQTALDKRFREVRVKPLEEQHVKALVTHAYEDVYRLDVRRRERKTAELLDGIDRLEDDRRSRLGADVEPLVTSPLLVRMLIIVHQREGRNLPEQRAELYWKATEAMLEPEYALDEEVAGRIGRFIGGDRNLHRDLSQHLAFHMHSRGEQQGREIDEAGLRAVLGMDSRFAPLIDDYIALTRLRGTLVEELLGTYRFVHLAFQEFLAARYLAEVRRGEGIDAVADFLEKGAVLDSWWREAALLVPGYLAFTSESNALTLLRRLAGIDENAEVRNRAIAHDVQLAATEIAAEAIMEWETDKVELRESVARRLEVLLTDKHLTASNPLRAAAGRALSRLGDPRLEVNCEIPFTVNISASAGPFRMGSDTKDSDSPHYDEMAYPDEDPSHIVNWLDFDYNIGKYPVTVGQYRLFVEADGYDPETSAAFWKGGGLEWLKESGQRAPRLWDDPHWTVDNHPVVGVTWYEAVAYCEWLTAVGKKLTPRRGPFRLPDEAMWEKAARGTDGRRWPWEGEFDKTKLNSSEGGIGRTSAVGIFPAGKSPNDVYDCAGNVLEWCSGPGYSEDDAKYPLPQRLYEEDLNLAVGVRALRGGSWNNNDQNTRAAYRNNNNPNNRNNNIGFRVAELLSKGDRKCDVSTVASPREERSTLKSPVSLRTGRAPFRACNESLPRPPVGFAPTAGGALYFTQGNGR